MNFYHFLKFTVGKPEVITNWLFPKQRTHELTIVFLWLFFEVTKVEITWLSYPRYRLGLVSFWKKETIWRNVAKKEVSVSFLSPLQARLPSGEPHGYGNINGRTLHLWEKRLDYVLLGQNRWRTAWIRGNGRRASLDTAKCRCQFWLAIRG